MNGLASAANLGGTAFSYEWASVAGQVEYELYLKKGGLDEMTVSDTFAKDKTEFITLLSKKAAKICYECSGELDEETGFSLFTLKKTQLISIKLMLHQVARD